MRYIRLYIFLVAGFILCTSYKCFSQNYSSRITIVGNSFDNKTFTKKEIHSLFKGNKSNWDNGTSITSVLALNESDEKSKYIAEEIYNKSVLSVKKYWLGLVFQGRSEAPIFVSNNEEVLEVVKKNTGAIGILVDYKGNLNANLLLSILD